MTRAVLSLLLAVTSACGASTACRGCGEPSESSSNVAPDRSSDPSNETSNESSSHAVRLVVDHAGEPRAVSPFVFGVNGLELLEVAPEGTFTLARFGGTRASTYNWENDASNGASDHFHQNDGFFPSDGTPASAWLDFVRRASRRQARSLLTVSMIGHVSADRAADGDVAATPDYLARRFRRSTARGADPTSPPRLDDEVVCQESGVAYAEARTEGAVLGYALDNEPGAWPAVHPRLRERPTTYAELLDASEAHAAAIRARAPRAWVFGPVSFGWAEMVRLIGAPDANDRDFLDTYLTQASEWERRHGARLLDVLDVHWYPEVRLGDAPVTTDDVSPEIAALRMQSPRSLYDPGYVEPSWITRDWLADEPIRLLPRLRAKIDRHYPGTRLAITEWHYGGGSDVSGAVAAADALGAFTRHADVAALWPLTNLREHDAVVGAFRMYRDAALRFGATSFPVASDDVASANAWASVDASGRVRVVVVVRRVGLTVVRLDVRASRLRRFDLDVASWTPREVGAYELDAQEPDAQEPDARGIRFEVRGPAVVTLVEP